MGAEKPSIKNRPYTPVLGLMSASETGAAESVTLRPTDKPQPQATGVFDQPEPEQLLELTVIVPARNEADCLAACLNSLVAQSESIFELGRDWELIVVDDHSTDETRKIASSFANVTVLEADALALGWTGKCNAVWTAARKARGRWLLFTDADTIHQQGDLRRAIHEAIKNKVGMLSYSPRQIVTGLAQRTLMPLIFSELTLAYPSKQICDPANPIAAANGQFLLVERETYRRIGGHKAVASKVLEDVELAILAKRRNCGLRFRYAPDALATHMYRTTEAMNEGWSKNLAHLFANCRALAFWRCIDLLLIFGLPILVVDLWSLPLSPLVPWLTTGVVIGVLWARTLVRFYNRVLKSNFSLTDCLLTPLGLPHFIRLLYQSWYLHNVKKRVVWKGRTYNERGVMPAKSTDSTKNNCN